MRSSLDVSETSETHYGSVSDHGTAVLRTPLESFSEDEYDSDIEEYFHEKHGLLHHSFPTNEAPYPLCYDRFATDADALAGCTLTELRGSVTAIRFEDGIYPKSCLDVGCGRGAWVLEAATRWPTTHFTGFDLVPIQPDLDFFPDEFSDRISWVNGNFLKPWPFQDNTFDHVYIRGIAKGVPEDKWDFFFSELERVMTPGAAVEIFEDDIFFPSLTPKDKNGKRLPLPPVLSLPNVSSTSVQSNSSEFSDATRSTHYSHLNSGIDEAFLEELYLDVFRNRKINLTPTSLIPYHLNIWLRHTVIAPAIHVPIPEREGLPPLSFSSVQSSPIAEQPGAVDGVYAEAGDSTAMAEALQNVSPSNGSSLDPSEPPSPDTADPFLIELYTASSTRSPQPRVMRRRKVIISNKALSGSVIISVYNVLAAKEAMWDEFVSREKWEPSQMGQREVRLLRNDFERALRVYLADWRKFLGTNLSQPPLVPDELLSESPTSSSSSLPLLGNHRFGSDTEPPSPPTPLTSHPPPNVSSFDSMYTTRTNGSTAIGSASSIASTNAGTLLNHNDDIIRGIVTRVVRFVCGFKPDSPSKQRKTTPISVPRPM